MTNAIPPYIYAGLEFNGVAPTVSPNTNTEKWMIKELRAEWNYLLDAKMTLIDRSLKTKLTPASHGEIIFEMAKLTARMKEIDGQANFIATGRLPGTLKITVLNYARFEINKVKAQSFEEINYLRSKNSKLQNRNTVLAAKIHSLYIMNARLKTQKHEEGNPA